MIRKWGEFLLIRSRWRQHGLSNHFSDIWQIKWIHSWVNIKLLWEDKKISVC